MAEEFLQFLSGVVIRIKVKDGVPGKPEVIKRFVSPIKGTQQSIRKKSQPKQLESDSAEEVYFEDLTGFTQ